MSDFNVGWTKKTWSKKIVQGGRNLGKITVSARFNDECRNGHDTFAITGEILNNQGEEVAGGCIHDEITEHFPELAGVIKWHLCSTDGPLHYLANTLYLAGDKDCNGRQKGEVARQKKVLLFENVPITHELGQDFLGWLDSVKDGGSNKYAPYALESVHHPEEGKPGKYQFKPNYTFNEYPKKWHQCPFKSATEAHEYASALTECKWKVEEVATDWAEGKERELDLARRAAAWPEATDEQLCDPNLKDLLVARLPKLLENFESDLRKLG